MYLTYKSVLCLKISVFTGISELKKQNYNKNGLIHVLIITNAYVFYK